MKKLFKKMTAVALSLTMVAGTVCITNAAVKTGTDVSAGKNWESYSIYTHEDHVNGESTAKKNVCWYHSLINTSNILTNQHYFGDKVTDAQIKELNATIIANNKLKGTTTPTVTKHAETWGEQDAYKCFGENAKITTQTSSSFSMDVVSTGWNAKWRPSSKKDSSGNAIYQVYQSNPWGITANKIVNVERGRYYTISFKIKSTLQNEIKETLKREDGTGYNVGNGTYNYIKHVHFKAYDDKDEDGAALTLSNLTATIGGKNALVKGNKTINEDFDSFITLDSKNTADDGWVTVSAQVLIPSDAADYQGKAKTPTMGIKFAFGAFLKEYSVENDMSGTIQIKDFTVKAGKTATKPAKVKNLKVKAGKKSMTVSFKKAKNAKKYQIQYSTNKNYKNVKTKLTSKTKITIKKLKSNKKYYVRVRGYYSTSGCKIYGAYTKKTVKIK